MLLGYARVSTTDQNLSVQLETLSGAGCQQIFQEKISGAVADRPELSRLCQILRPGDTVVVTHLDRLGRDSNHMMQLVTEWGAAGIHFRSLDLGVDTGSISGSLVLKIFAALAEYGRQLIREKSLAGQELARAKGKHMGRPAGLDEVKLQKIKTAQALGMSVSEIVTMTGIAESTVKRYRKYLLERII